MEKNMITERYIVSKFGGTSMKDARSVEQSAKVFRSNPDRLFGVVSAPGKRHKDDEKVTDQLLKVQKLAGEDSDFDQEFDKVADRYIPVGKELQIPGVFNWLDELHKGIERHKRGGWIPSRGEWLQAKVFAEVVGASFVDAANLIRLRRNGQIDPITYQIIKEQLLPGSILPGFYGADERGSIITFPRGGSDITGAIIARGVNARLYENCTDVNGLLVVSNKLVNEPESVSEATYDELRELEYRGVEVVQGDAILPAYEARIPIRIMSTFNPDHPGTLILPERISPPGEGVIGIAGKDGFIAFHIQKFNMSREVGVLHRVSRVFVKEKIPLDDITASRDLLSFIIHKDILNGKEQQIRQGIERAVHPNNIYISNNLALVCLVGQDLRNDRSVIDDKALPALRAAQIPVRHQNHPESGISVTIGVDSDKLDEAMRVLYKALF